MITIIVRLLLVILVVVVAAVIGHLEVQLKIFINYEE